MVNRFEFAFLLDNACSFCNSGAGKDNSGMIEILEERKTTHPHEEFVLGAFQETCRDCLNSDNPEEIAITDRYSCGYRTELFK